MPLRGLFGGKSEDDFNKSSKNQGTENNSTVPVQPDKNVYIERAAEKAKNVANMSPEEREMFFSLLQSSNLMPEGAKKDTEKKTDIPFDKSKLGSTIYNVDGHNYTVDDIQKAVELAVQAGAIKVKADGDQTDSQQQGGNGAPAAGFTPAFYGGGIPAHVNGDFQLQGGPAPYIPYDVYTHMGEYLYNAVNYGMVHPSLITAFTALTPAMGVGAYAMIDQALLRSCTVMYRPKTGGDRLYSREDADRWLSSMPVRLALKDAFEAVICDTHGNPVARDVAERYVSLVRANDKGSGPKSLPAGDGGDKEKKDKN